jgi:cell division protein FtsI/penicillin-binding protein 2
VNTPRRRRALLVITGFAFGFTMISVRLIFLQLVDHDRYVEEADQTHYELVAVPPRRGTIMDARGRTLAETLRLIDLYVDGQLALEDPDRLIDVARLLGISSDDLKAQLSPKNRFRKVATNVPAETVQALRELDYFPLIFQERLQRVYPNGREGSHLIGFTNRVEEEFHAGSLRINSERGMIGVEQIMDHYLRGIPGERRVVKDGNRDEIAAFRQYERSPRNGLNVVMSLDSGIQHIVEMEADRLQGEFEPESLNIIVVRPSTGEILGMTNRPTFDPNDRRDLQPVQLRNGAIMDLFEPGSIFKTITLAAALNEGLVDLDTPLFCENGKYFYANRWLYDTSPHGLLPVDECLAVSSNIAFAKIGVQLRKERLYRYIRQFGFGETRQNPDFALQGEVAGILRPPHYWSKISPTRIPIGYEIAATNLQMSMAVAALANEGKLMEPMLIKALVDEEGNLVKQYLPRVVRQVVQKEVAEKAARAMEKVVSEGTGRSAAVDGFSAAGKTGTSRKVIEGSYAQGAYYASFIGFMPAEDPKFLVSVVVNQPQGDSYYASKVAAPAFSRISRRVAQQLDLVKSTNGVVASLPEGRQP